MSWPANPSNGQQVIVNGILYSYNATNLTWDRIGYTASAVTTDEIVISRLTILQRAVLGDVANISISGGTVGQVLQTDGTGNLSWKTESTLAAGGSNTYIQFNDGGTDLGGVANFAFDKTSNTLTVDYGNLVLTTEANAQPNITTVGTLTNLAVTGNLSVGGNSSVTGNVTVSGNVTTTGTITAGAYTSPGSNNQILLNKSGNINGSSNLTFTNSNLLAVTGNITANNVTANTFTGNLTTAAQPNITSVGTLTSLSVTGNVTAGNIKVAFANANIYNAPNSSANTQILLNKAGNIGSYSNLTFDGNLLTVIGNVTATNANLGNAVVANYFTGNILTGAQPAITSIGTLDSLIVTGNISSGNASLGNLASANYISGVLTSSSQPNITTVGSLANLRVLGNANIDGNLYIGGTTIGAGGITAPSFTGNLNGNVSGVLTAPGSDKQMLFNKTGNVGASANITFTEGSGGINPANLTVIGNIRANSISAVSTLSAPNLTGTLTTASQPNITSVGTLNSLTLDGGDTTLRNTIIDTTANVQIRGPLIPSGFEEYDIGTPEHHWRDLYLAGSTIRLGSTTITASNDGGVVVSGSVTAEGGFSSDTSAAGTPLETLDATSSGGISTITFPEQIVPPYSVNGKITVEGVTPTGYNGTWTVISSTTSTVSFYETVVGSMAVAGTVVSGGNPPFTVTSTLMVANLNVEYLQGYTPTTIDSADTIVQRDANSNFQANAITANRLIGIADRANTVTNSSQPNITSVGSLLTLDVLGTITGANLDIADYVDATWVRANIRDSDGYLGSKIVGQVAYANIANRVAGSNVDGQVSNSAIAGSVYSNAQPNISSVGILDSLHVSGDTDIDGNLYVGGTTVSAGGLSASTISGTLSGTFVSPGSNTEILFNKQGVIGTDSDFKYNSLTKSLSITGQLVSVDANLGNLVEANYFKGNGYYLAHIQGLNIEGEVPVANKAGTVTSSSQPNITSTGTLTTLHVSGDALIDGDLTVGGTTISQGGLSTSTLSIDKGVTTVDQPFSINETWSNSLVSFTSFQQEIIDTASDPTSLLAEFNVNGLNVFKVDKTGNVTAKDITARYVAGTITFASQPNITSVGTLSSLDVTANITSGNANLGNAVHANYFIGDGTYLTGLPRPTELKNENDSSNVKIGTDGNVTISVLGTTNTGIFSGSNLTIKDTIISANANLGDIASANFFVGNGNSLANIRGANVTGYVPLATAANTVTTNAQPNITSVGTLTSLIVTGATNPSLGNAVTANFFVGKFTSGASSQPNITSVGTLTTLTTSATVEASLGNSVTSNYFKGNGYYLFNITGSNVTGTVASATVATTAGTVTEAAQPSITSVGTLTSLDVAGITTTQDITVTGNLTVSGDTITANVTGLVVKDPLIEMGGNLNGVLTTNDGYDRGAVMRYYDTAPQTAFMGWKNSAKEFTFASKATIATNIATIGDLGNIKAGNANIIGNIKAGGNLIGILDTTSNNQPNISNVGKLIGLVVGNSTNFATHGNGTINTNGNIIVSSGYFFVGDGSKLTGIDTSTIKNGTSNVSIATLNGGVTTVVNGLTIANVISTGIIITGNANASSFNATSQFVSTVATGTAPLVINSTTLVPNLNAATAATAVTATTATNISGGVAGGVHYQTGVGATSITAAGTSGQYLQSTGTAVQWATINTDRISNGTTTVTVSSATGPILANISGITIANIVGTGILITGNANASSFNATSQFVSTVATGTAPLVVNSTTKVANLYANVSDFSTMTVATTGTYYPTLVGSSTAGAQQEFVSASLSFNAATGGLSATDLTLSGNLVVNGTTTTVNSTTTRIVDPVVELGGGVNGAALTTADGKDRGLLLHYAQSPAGTSGSRVGFNGTSQYITTPTNANFALPGDFTIEAYVKPTNFTNNSVLFSQGASATASPFSFGIGTDGKPYINFGILYGTTTENATATYTAPTGTAFTSILYTSYGQGPTGTAPNYVTATTNVTPVSTVTAAVTTAFLGKIGTQSIVASTAVLAGGVDPYSGFVKTFAVVLSYGFIATTALTAGVYSHVAVTRIGSTVTIYINGVAAGSTTYSASIGSGTITPNTFGASYQSPGVNSLYFNGSISNFRLIKGQGIYTGAFTLGNQVLTATTVGSTGTGVVTSFTGTVAALTFQNTTIVDNSPSPLTLTAIGTPIVDTTGPVLQVTTSLIDGFIGYKPSTSEFIFANSVTTTSEVVTVTTYGNVRASNFTGTTFTGTTFTGTAAKATNLAGGTAGGVPYQTNTNVTSILPIGTTGQYLQSTGTAIQWATLNTDRISNGTSNVSIPVTNGNVVVGVNGIDSVVTVSGTGVSIIGNISGNLLTSTGYQTPLTTPTFGTSVTYDMSTATTFYHSSVTSNWTAALTNDNTTLNSKTQTITILVQQGTTPYIPSAVTINGTSQTLKWLYGIVPAGTANALDVFSLTIIKVNGAYLTVAGSYATYS